MWGCRPTRLLLVMIGANARQATGGQRPFLARVQPGSTFTSRFLETRQRHIVFGDREANCSCKRTGRGVRTGVTRQRARISSKERLHTRPRPRPHRENRRESPRPCCRGHVASSTPLLTWHIAPKGPSIDSQLRDTYNFEPWGRVEQPRGRPASR